MSVTKLAAAALAALLFASCASDSATPDQNQDPEQVATPVLNPPPGDYG